MANLEEQDCLVFHLRSESSLEGLQSHHEGLILCVESIVEFLACKILRHVPYMSSKTQYVALICDGSVHNLITQDWVRKSHYVVQRRITKSLGCRHNVTALVAKIVFWKHQPMGQDLEDVT
jgi:hypothetical protein